MADLEARTDLIPLKAVKAKVGMGTTFIYAELRAGRFPKPVKRGRRSLWVRGEIDDYNSSDIAKRDVG